MAFFSRIIILLVFLIKLCDSSPLFPSSSRSKNQLCPKVATTLLEDILGAAFNPRYMSVDLPLQQKDTDAQLGGGGKRKVSAFVDDFYVDNTFTEVVDNNAAWDVNNHVEISKKSFGLHSRQKRAVKYQEEWSCISEIVWMDLGPDYFPRYLRSVKCLRNECWFGIYKCKPRSFTVKILRRREGFCSETLTKNNFNSVVGSVGLPHELRELWVWEERAVNFCCDCAR